jgi:uncharacterized protein YndB with AHSA1/START domain
MSQPGRYLERDGRPMVRFERIYAYPIDRVWAAVSEPDQLANWFPASVDYAPTVGGSVSFRGDPHLADLRGTVLAFDPPHTFAFTWGANEVHLELESLSGSSTRLTLTDLLTNPDEAARNAGGWTLCLGELDCVVADVPSQGPHSAENKERFLATYDSYVAAGLPHGAVIPE